ncbi:MAG: hypothetical protein LUB83_03345 [Prevotellaceae bacterium]|nr:hypothetical protein [Prevotellaceae bacterium]
MRKGNYRQRAYIKAALCGAALLMACASCVYDDYADTAAGSDNTVNVGITIRTASMASTRSDGYEDGSTYENYIDLDGGDYRVYFFTNDPDNDGNDTFIARFEPTYMATSTGKNYTEYTLYGEVTADEVTDLGSFKIMVLANWGTDNYPDGYFTNIDEACEAATYNAFVGDDGTALMPSEDRRIPFYGIHAYSGYTFEQGKAVTLSEPVTLLRAMAKVQVILESEGVAFSDVTLHRYNAKGYCAPDKVYSQDDYDHGADWSKDYLQDVHLVNNGANDSDAASNSMSFYKEQEADVQNGQYETWVAYLPEYSNTTNADDYASITIAVEGGDTHDIYFANYTDGETDNSYSDGDRFDIQRNNLYRFHVTVSAGNKAVYVENWTLLDEEEIDF